MVDAAETDFQGRARNWVGEDDRADGIQTLVGAYMVVCGEAYILAQVGRVAYTQALAGKEVCIPVLGGTVAYILVLDGMGVCTLVLDDREACIPVQDDKGACILVLDGMEVCTLVLGDTEVCIPALDDMVASVYTAVGILALAGAV